MTEAPAEAQQRFQSELGPALRTNGGFKLVKSRPGRLSYSDGKVTLEGYHEQRLVSEGYPLYAALRRVTARRLRIEFSEHEKGTMVQIRGAALRDLRLALGQLGGPGRWPQARRMAGDENPGA